MGNLTPIQAAQEAKKHGIKVYTIGLGGSEEARIPVGRSVFGPQYQVIPGGSIDYKSLQEISKLTGGKFYPAKDSEGLTRIMSDINQLERTEIKVENQVIYDEHYHRYFALGLILILAAEALRRILLREVV
jgi:Ca-activated chloride channel homolog